MLDKLFLEAIREISRENFLSTFCFQLIFQLKSGNQPYFFQVEFAKFYSLSVSMKFIWIATFLSHRKRKLPFSLKYVFI